MKKRKKQNFYTDIERNNKTAITAHRSITIVMLIFCLLQALGGLQTWLYMLVISTLGLAPVIAESLIWKSDPKSPKIKHYFAVGFFIFYTAALFTSTNNMVFLFVIPMILVASVYNNTRYALTLNLVVIAESLIVVFLGAATGKFGYAGRDSSIIQIVITILVAFYSYSTSKTINLNLTQKLEHISDIALHTQKSVEEISGEFNSLNTSFQDVKHAMRDVTNGISNTAEAAQNQFLQTEAIEKQAGIVKQGATQIFESMQKTLAYIENGNSDVTNLLSYVDTSVKSSTDAVEKLEVLNKHMNEMHSIVRLIDNIAFQTKILSLNAMIEAARVGDAGRGFSVVAAEMSEMSDRTQIATEQITSLISNVTESINNVADVMQQMISRIQQEHEGASHTFESFSSIKTNTIEVRDNVSALIESLSELLKANRGISGYIQTISAVSEQVYALAGETMNSEEKNAKILEDISDKMQKLTVTGVNDIPDDVMHTGADNKQ